FKGSGIVAVVVVPLKAALHEETVDGKRGHLSVAVTPAVYGVRDGGARTADYAAELKASRRSKGTSEIVMPGERGYRKKMEYERHGIPLARSIWDNTLKIASDLGVELPKLS